MFIELKELIRKRKQIIIKNPQKWNFRCCLSGQCTGHKRHRQRTSNTEKNLKKQKLHIEGDTKCRCSHQHTHLTTWLYLPTIYLVFNLLPKNFTSFKNKFQESDFRFLTRSDWRSNFELYSSSPLFKIDFLFSEIDLGRGKSKTKIQV